MTIAQAAVGAILIVAIGDAEAGPARLIDALVGASVALIFRLLLFTPEPVTLIRRAEGARALKEMAKGLALTEKAMRDDEDDAGERALERLGACATSSVRQLARTRAAGHQICGGRRAGASQRSPLVREAENAGHLDLLGGSLSGPRPHQPVGRPRGPPHHGPAGPRARRRPLRPGREPRRSRNPPRESPIGRSPSADNARRRPQRRNRGWRRS